jgi:hypothetical protein
VAPGRQKHGLWSLWHREATFYPAPRFRSGWARKLRTKKGKREYSKRKGTVEPVFGQIRKCVACDASC